jgi:hypothetical protein
MTIAELKKDLSDVGGVVRTSGRLIGISRPHVGPRHATRWTGRSRCWGWRGSKTLGRRGSGLRAAPREQIAGLGRRRAV